MFKKRENAKARKIAISCTIAIFAIAIALVAILIANKGGKTKERTIVAGPELARAMTYDQFQDGDEDIDGTDYVKFGAFFLRDVNGDGYAEKIKGTCKQIGKEDTLYMELNVLTNGYLENGVITINGNNFYLQTAIPKDSEIKDNVISNNTKQISLNQINNGTQKLLTGIVRAGDYTYDSGRYAAIGNDTTKMSGTNTITLTGTHVAADGTRTQINKTIDLTMDWYGSAKAEIPSYFLATRNLNQLNDNSNVIDEANNRAVFDFELAIQEVENNILLSKTCIEGTLPQLNGYDPIGVETGDESQISTYDPATKTFTVSKSAELNDNGTIKKECFDNVYYSSSKGKIRYNKFKIKIIYPLEAYQASGGDTVELRIPIKGYFEGYNNPNAEFTQPYQSAKNNQTLILTYSKPTGDVGKVLVYVGKYIYEPNRRYVVSKRKPLKIYNEMSTEEKDDTYPVRWILSTGKQGETTGFKVKETANGAAQVSDQFIKADSTLDSAESAVSNVGIGFSNPVNMLGEDGWIKVYDDETGDLIHEFTKSDWTKYTEASPYRYPYQIKHVRVETSATQPSTSFSIYNIKEIDDEYMTTNYTREEFDNLKYVKSTVVGYVGDSYLNQDTMSATYETPYAYAKTILNKTAISTQETEKDMQIKISAEGDEQANYEKWKNGTFLVKMPKDIIDVEINSVEVDSKNVTITSYETYEENSERFIKINTTNETPTAYTLTINGHITPDPRIPTTTETVEVYTSNEEAVDYHNATEDIYDINGNQNTSEKIGKATVNLSLVSPNSLLTNQVATNYDEAGSVAVAPQSAVVSKEKRSATVNIEINNNYSSTISNVQILGRVPFKGNKYAISNEDMGSTFTTTMTNAGITVPDTLKSTATIYYSENGEATNDLSKAANGWTTTPSDYSKIKSYLVDLGEYKLNKGEKHTISYNINIPEGLNYNQVAYSHHGVYFCLDTEGGKYKTRTEPNKVGFMIAKQYDLELTKYQKNKTNIVSGATYAVYEEGNEEARTRATGIDGKLTLTGLYVDRTYVVKEIKTPDDYELNEEVVKFTTSESNAVLTVTKISGTTKKIQAVQATANTGYKVELEVEDEAKVRLKIKKTEKGSTTAVKGIGFKITGTGLPENGKGVNTNTNGEITLKGLKVGEEYTIEETKATGYYKITNPIKFKVTNNNGTYTASITSGETKSTTVTEEENIPVITINLEDEKIPTYNLEITKIKKVTSVTSGEGGSQEEATTYLQGAKFKLYKGEKELGSYITDANGKITISNLYQYIDGKDEDATYMLKETLAPDGYAKVKDITFKVDGSTGELKFVNTEGKEEKYTVEGTTVKLTIEDSPSFKLIKKDGESGARLAGIKFAIYNVEEGSTPAKNSKGEIIGTKETINGKEYYTVTTDNNGELTADLPEGMYKAVEVQAPEKYDISEPYYFGIGASREGKTKLNTTWAKAIGGEGTEIINTVIETSDGGYIVGGNFSSSSIDLGNEISLINVDSYDGMIIKYRSSGEVEWAQVIGGTSLDYIVSIAETSDGGYIAGGYFLSSSIDLGNGVSLKSNGSYDGMIIKYRSSGEVEWAQVIGGTSYEYIDSIVEASDGGYIIVGDFQSRSIDLGNGVNLSNKGSKDVMIIKYNSEGTVEWAQGIGGTQDDEIHSIAVTRDGGYIVGGHFESSSIDLGNGVSLSNKGAEDGMIIKYRSSGEAEWAQVIGGTQDDEITSVAATSDGGYIVGGYFHSSIDLGNGVSLSNKGSNDGMIIKYNVNGEAEWARGIGGTDGDEITSVAETSDGGYIVGGYFYSSSIDLGNEVSLINKGHSNGMIIKYRSSGEAEWAQGIGGDDYDKIISAVETSDGGYIIGGYLLSSSIDLGNGVSLINSGNYDGMVIKFEKTELPNPTVVQAQEIGGTGNENINIVAKTNDGGYIVGGNFSSKSIDLENGESLNLIENGNYDGMIIKYNAIGKIEWKKVIGSSGADYITSITETKDGGYIVGGYFGGGRFTLENGQNLSLKGHYDGMIIKYNSYGNIEWAQGIGGVEEDRITSVAETSDGGYIVGGYFESRSIDLGNGVSLSTKGNYDGMIIKYNVNGEVEWAKEIGGTGEDRITSVAGTSDGGCIIGGYFSSTSMILEEGVRLTNLSVDSWDGVLVKYNSKGELEWVQGIGGIGDEQINSVAATKDGGCIIGGRFGSTSVDLGNEVSLISSTGQSYNSGDGMLIKYNSDGKAEWAQVIGKGGLEEIDSVAETNDGGYLVGGVFSSTSIDLGNGVSLTTKGSVDAMLIKYNSERKAEWARGIGGTRGDYINSVAETSDGAYIAGGYFWSDIIEIENNITLTRKGNTDGMVLKIVEQIGVPEVQELEITNNRKTFKITTDVKKIDNIKGGSISGEDATPYEKVKYGDTSTREIKMVPDEGYEIIGITVNGEEYKYTANADGSYTMPTFTNMMEDKHIVVTYSLKDNKITINKVDKDTKEKLTGAKFKLDQIEERSEPNSSNIIGTLTDNGEEYTEVDITSEVTGKLGTLTNNGTYYFVQNSDGTYVPTNSKTHQTSNGGTAGIQNVTANSYVSIDLTGLTGQYAVVINARCSSENSDYGYATITEDTTAPTYNSTTGRFMYISGTKSNLDYTSSVLEGGKTYYLHLGYRKDSSADTGEDQVVINSIKLYNATKSTFTYNFINNNGKYESTNQGKDNTVANSYVPIDLTNYTGKYNLTVNAEVSSQSGDYGYATVTENTTRPAYNSSTGRFIYVSGTRTAKDYTTELQGGKMYYLHLGYYKNASTSEGDDKFTVNSINISLSDSELYHTTVETNSDGQAITQIPFGKYNLTEIKAPEGYTLDSTPRVIEFRSTTGATHEFTVENEKKAQVIVHHYAKNTTTKLAEDEQYESTVGAKYTTSPKLDLVPYKLEVDNNGAYVLPANATGTYKTGTTEVDYYYVENEIPLTVHHYIEGTTEKVPLKAGGTADDVTGSGQTGTTYKTSAIADNLLSDEYELAETPVNATGIYEGSEVVVTYYYKKAKRPVIVAKTDEKGDPLAGAKFTIDGIEYTTDSNGLIEVTLEVGTHEIAEIEAPDGYKITAAPSTETITKQNTSTRVQIANYRQTGTVTVHHYIQGTTTRVPLADGTTAKDETKTGNVGDIYATQAKTNLSAGYELASEPDNSSGTYINGNIDVIYYYKTIPAKVTVHHYLEGTTTKLANDETINGLAGDNYTTSVGNVENKYELVATPANAKGTMTREGIEVIYYYRLKSTSVLVHHYIEGTTTSLSADQTIQGKVDAAYTTSPATDIPSKYELVATPSNASGTMTVAQIVVTYYYRLKESGVDVHYYIEGTTVKVSEDKTINGKVDTPYTTSPATDVPSKYELVATPSNASGTMTEARITVIYYYRLKDTSVLVHHYLENTTTKLANDETINGKVDDKYTTQKATTIPSKYELVATPTNASGTMTEAQIVVTYYYRLKSTSVLVHHYLEGTTTPLSKDQTIQGKVDDKYTTTKASDIPVQYELVATPANASGTMTEAQIVVTYYYRLLSYPYTVNYLEKGTNTVLHEPKQGDAQVYGTTITSSNEKIDIDGYNLDSYDKTTLTIGIANNVINIYYTKRTDLSYTVNYLEKGTNTVLQTPKTVKNVTFGTTITSSTEKININGYNYDSVDKATITIGTGANVINIYYTKRTDLSYTVNYLEKDTNAVIHTPKVENNMKFDDVVTANGEIIEIDGYNYDSVDKNSIKIGTGENVLNIYYTKKTDLSYTVNYLEKGTNKVLQNPKTVNNVTFGTTITSSTEKINIDGYNYDSVDKASITIGTGANVINIYYTKRTDLSYTVNYLEKGTNTVLHNPKTQTGMTFESTVDSSKEVIQINGYNYNSVDKNTLTIGTVDNIINIYYTKRTDLSYTVNYLEKGSNNILHEPKTQTGMTFESTVDSSKEVIAINGYNYDSVDKANITIGTGDNIINIYYTKKTDLTYTVNYLESVTNNVLHEPKVQDGMTFETKINAEDEVIDIEGYNYDYPDKYELIIGTGANVINIYYTKVTGLSYTINYLEKGTNKKLFPSDNKGNMTFGDTVTAANEVIDIDGYNYDSVDKDKLTIGMGDNIINIYYTKKTDLTYTVNYLETATNQVLHEPKVQKNMTFEDEVKAADEVIDINGYNYDSVDKDSIIIGTGDNIINIYYTKRTDLSYTVNYLEKGTNKVIHDPRTIENIIFEAEINTENEIIAIVGYNYDSVDKDKLIIGTGDNIINVYYTKRTDLSYTVNYLEKDTNNVIHKQKEVKNMTFEDQVKSSDEIITIYGYNYDSVDKDILTIGAEENTINIYYTKRDAKVTVHYYEENTTNQVSKDKTITGKVNDEYQTTVADDIPSKYELVAKPANASGTMTEDDITVTYYFRKKATQVIVKHLEEGTTNKLSKDVTIEGRVDDPYTTQPADDIPIKYELSITPDNANGTMTEETTTVTYYYRVKDAVVNIKYLEKNTNIELAPANKLEGKVDQDYQTQAQEIEGYQVVECDGDEQGKFTVEPITITYYYLYKTRATVEHIDKITGEFLERKTQEGLEGDDFITDSINKQDYILVEEPENKTIKMTKEEQTLRYYYIHISGGVIEKHIDIISGGILGNDTHEGKEGDPYDIKPRSIPGYDLVEDKLPDKAKGTMTIDPITVEYYYIYRTKVTAEYIDKNTGKKIETDEVITGHEADEYQTTRKIIDDYKLIEVPEKADGKMTKDEITVTYYYVHTSGGVIVDHLDVNTGKQVADQTKQEGYEGDPYETHEENVPGYELVKEKYPDNATGTLKIEETRVTYYYIKQTQINVKYVDMNTKKEIDEPTTIPGLEGDDYTTEPKEIPGYDLIEEPDNKEGTMTAEPFDVIYYYKRPAKVITKYIDKDTEEEIAKQTKQEGHENDEYTTEAKEIEYYELVETPENSEGTMTVTVTKDEETGEETVEDTTYVTYYYRKLIFNLNIDKKVASVTINGHETPINSGVAKIEVNKKELKTTTVEVKYTITVTNDSELTGKAKILEDIPAGMIMDPNKNNGWEARGTKATRETKELKPGESEEIQVILDWDNRQDNIGTKENTASIIKTENEAGYEENDQADNQDKADIIVAISTGKTTFVSTASGVLLILMAIACGIYIVKKQD